MTNERKIELERFLTFAHKMTYEELDPICGSFTDEDGAFVRRFEVGRNVLKLWVETGCVRELEAREFRHLINSGKVNMSNVTAPSEAIYSTNGLAKKAKCLAETVKRWALKTNSGVRDENGFFSFSEADLEAFLNRPKLSSAEAGRLGGLTNAQKGDGHNTSKAGKLGGSTTKKRYGADFYAKIGALGGKHTAKIHGTEFYEEIGKKGGAAIKEACKLLRESRAGNTPDKP